MGGHLWPEELDVLVPASTFDAVHGIRPHTDYQKDPIGWARDKLGIPEWMFRWSLCPGNPYDRHVWDGTKDPLALAFESVRDWKDVGIESGTGTGKSFGVAVLILWFLACWENAQVYTFAPVEKQLRLYIWKNITELWPKFTAHFPSAQKTDLTLRMRGGTDETWAAHGYAVGVKADQQVSVSASGMHAEHMLLVYEETTGIPLSVMEAGKNTCTAPHNIRIGIGNPNHQLDSLHLMCGEPGVVGIRISSLDHPNVVADDPALIPGAISKKRTEQRLAEYGANDPIYLARVRGVSPEQASNALIRMEWLKAARVRYEARAKAGTLPVIVTGKGVDVANSEHGDEAAIVDFADNVLVRADAFPCPDANLLGDAVIKEMRGLNRFGTPPLAGYRVGVDSIGVGAGTVNEMRRQKVIVQALIAGGKPVKQTERAPDGYTYEWAADSNTFRNLRSQMYWQLREDLRNGVIDMPYDQELWEELVAVTYEDDDEKITLQPKDEVRVALGRSPNKGDACVMANWVRHRARPAVDRDNGERQGVTLGYDYAHRRPAERKTAEQELSEMFTRHQPDPLVGRNKLPHRG